MTHYGSSEPNIVTACGIPRIVMRSVSARSQRGGEGIIYSSQDASRVTCKNCRRTKMLRAAQTGQ